MFDNNFKYEIEEKLGIISENNGTTIEVNLISFNGARPKIDIRKWDHSNNKMLKGISLTEQEAKDLCKYLNNKFHLFEKGL